jgi:hypothetical protein
VLDGFGLRAAAFALADEMAAGVASTPHKIMSPQKRRTSEVTRSHAGSRGQSPACPWLGKSHVSTGSSIIAKPRMSQPASNDLIERLLASPMGYERQRVPLAVIVVKPVALETAGNRSKHHSGRRWFCSRLSSTGGSDRRRRAHFCSRRFVGWTRASA